METSYILRTNTTPLAKGRKRVLFGRVQRAPVPIS